MTPRRHNTNLSDTSQSSTASNQLNANSMSVQASPRPMTPRPLTRAELGEVLANAPAGTTADQIRDSLDEHGDRNLDQLVSGMPTAQDPDASSRPPSREDDAHDPTTPSTTHPKGLKRLGREMESMKASSRSYSHDHKRPRLDQELERFDKCFGNHGESSGAAAETDNAVEQDYHDGDEHDTKTNGHPTDDSEGSREQMPMTPSNDGDGDDDNDNDDNDKGST